MLRVAGIYDIPFDDDFYNEEPPEVLPAYDDGDDVGNNDGAGVVQVGVGAVNGRDLLRMATDEL